MVSPSGRTRGHAGSEMRRTKSIRTGTSKRHAKRVGPRPHLSIKTLLSLLETAPDAIVVIDPSGVIVLVDAETENMFGYDRLDLVGKKVETLVPLHNRDRHVQQRRPRLSNLRGSAPWGSGLPLFGLSKDEPRVPRRDQPQSTQDGGGHSGSPVPFAM